MTSDIPTPERVEECIQNLQRSADYVQGIPELQSEYDFNIDTITCLRELQRTMMTEELVMRHIAWGCRTCNKIDWVDNEAACAKPEHVPYRGVDIGICSGKMEKLYSEK